MNKKNWTCDWKNSGKKRQVYPLQFNHLLLVLCRFCKNRRSPSINHTINLCGVCIFPLKFNGSKSSCFGLLQTTIRYLFSTLKKLEHKFDSKDHYVKLSGLLKYLFYLLKTTFY